MHDPLWHVARPIQLLLQAPQCSESVSRSTQALSHSVRLDLHAHFFFLQVAPLQQSLLLSHFLPSFLHAATADHGDIVAAETATPSVEIKPRRVTSMAKRRAKSSRRCLPIVRPPSLGQSALPRMRSETTPPAE